ncbi:MAG: hypothetical protein OMM_14408 [Candidatus Magnetoglobus multicellularis str. Araruama]|uniref:Uncharacterized protein n=1 Tax=Candidatus Magnetoglobus multicellularis str. Araruama TaxID=890399 RepID=A0A1V1NRY7_9BACT|nr:MAG: hypothetical protein OMM_14408 [Candidatus Magnetoglobus multicellularis str. Araruama]
MRQERIVLAPAESLKDSFWGGREMIKEQFAKKCLLLGKNPSEVSRQLMKHFVNAGNRHAHDGLYRIIEIESSSDIYSLLRAQMGSDWASLDALCHMLHIEGIDRSVLLSAAGRAQSLVKIEDISRLFWERSNFGMRDEKSVG